MQILASNLNLRPSFDLRKGGHPLLPHRCATGGHTDIIETYSLFIPHMSSSNCSSPGSWRVWNRDELNIPLENLSGPLSAVDWFVFSSSGGLVPLELWWQIHWCITTNVNAVSTQRPSPHRHRHATSWPSRNLYMTSWPSRDLHVTSRPSLNLNITSRDAPESPPTNNWSTEVNGRNIQGWVVVVNR